MSVREYTDKEYEQLVDIYNAYIQAANEGRTIIYPQENGEFSGMQLRYSEIDDTFEVIHCDEQVNFLAALREEILDYTYMNSATDNDEE